MAGNRQRRGYRKLAVSWDFSESGMERSADGDILSSVWNSRRQVVEETAGEEGCNKKSGKNPEKSGAEKVSVSGTDGNREEEHKNQWLITRNQRIWRLKI